MSDTPAPTEEPRVQRIWIPVVLPGFNQLAGRGVRDKIRTKRKALDDVGLFVKKLRPVRRAFFRYHHVVPNRRRDPSNTAAGNRKVIEDSLQEWGIIPGDGWAVVAGFADTFEVNPRAPGVLLTLEEIAT